MGSTGANRATGGVASNGNNYPEYEALVREASDEQLRYMFTQNMSAGNQEAVRIVTSEMNRRQTSNNSNPVDAFQAWAADEQTRMWTAQDTVFNTAKNVDEVLQQFEQRTGYQFTDERSRRSLRNFIRNTWGFIR